MKKFLIVLLFVPTFVFAQQKKKQIKRMLENIAANKVYIEYLQKGYNIARSGLKSIRDIKKGDFNLHLNFIDSLQKVNPNIKRWARVTEIITFQIKIIRTTRGAIKEIKLRPDEMDYCRKLFTNLLEDCANNIDELMMLVTDSKVTMTDAERIKRIDKLYMDMQDKFAFISSFTNDMAMLSIQRTTEQVNINYSKKINGY
jgi:hypothetical protein